MNWQHYNPDENSDHGDHFRNPFDAPGYGESVADEIAAWDRAREAEMAAMRRQPVETIGDDPCRNPGCREGDVSDPVTGAVLACPECGGSTSRAWVSHHDAIAAQIIRNWEAAE